MFDRLVPLLPASIRAQADATPAALSKDPCVQRLALTAWEDLWGLANIVGLTSLAPFTGQPGNARRLRDLRLRMADLRQQQTSAAAEQACRLYTEALARRPDDTALRRGFGTLLLTLGRHAQAQEHFLRVLAALPEDPDALMQAGMAAGAQGRIAEGEAYLRRFIEVSPSSARACLELSASFGNGEMWELALSYALESLSHQADQPRALHLAGLANLRLGRNAKAIEFLRRSIALDPYNSDAHCDLGGALRKSGKAADATAAIAEAARVDPLAARPRFIQARIRQSQGELGQADKLYQLAVHLQPEYVEARHAYAGLLAQQGDYSRALEQYHQALRFGPKSWRIRMDMAQLLATCPDAAVRDPRRALQLALQAAEMADRRHPDALEVLAVCLAETGQFDKALQVVRQALSMGTVSQQPQTLDRLHQLRRLFEAGRRVSDVAWPAGSGN